jgi:hypothetical protein
MASPEKPLLLELQARHEQAQSASLVRENVLLRIENIMECCTLSTALRGPRSLRDVGMITDNGAPVMQRKRTP